MALRLLALVIAAALLAQAPVQTQNLILNAFRDYVESLRIQAGIPGLAVGVIGQDSVLWREAFGEQDIGRAVATRTDTPFHLDGVTQVVTATLVLRCMEDGRLTLDDPIGRFRADSPYATATVRELLTHTTTGADGVVFEYSPERLDALDDVVSVCTRQSFRESVATLLNRLGMANSVPGPDVLSLEPTADYAPPVERYDHVLQRLATPYAVDRKGRFTESRYTVTTLTPTAGLISSVEDFAWFDLELKNSLLVSAETFALSWQPLISREGIALPHGLGWFVETYRGQPVIWQFGVSENASSSLVVMTQQGLTFVAVANSDGLARPFMLAEGDLMQSPFARLFLELFVQG